MENKPHIIKSISDFHAFHNLPKPEHPLISIVDYAKIKNSRTEPTTTLIFGFYTVSLKRGVNYMHYGQQPYDFNDGLLYFMAPGQVLKVNNDQKEKRNRSGWMLLIHPDFLWNTTLATKINRYEFFDYSVHEALFLSEKEEDILKSVVQNIQHEYQANIDQFTQGIIISHIETLLNYSERFYQRQFITRKITNHQILDKLEKLLEDYFNSDDITLKGLPTVQSIADRLNVSSSYLSSLLKLLTGQSTQQHIHDKLISKAKEKLSTTELTVSEIAYELGFEHPQSFSKLFKSKTNQSPLEFRHSFN
jgi:AraC family transcriptional activator of pobA